MLLEEAGGNKGLAELTGRTPGQIGNIKSTGRIGAALAASLEKAMSKPEGWMDQWTAAEGGWDGPVRTRSWHLVRLLDELPEDIRASLSKTIIASHKEARQRASKKKKSV